MKSHIRAMAGDYRAAAVSYLRLLIDQTGKTASELAAMVNASHTTFTRPLSNPNYKYAPKFPKLQRLSELTGVPLTADLQSATKEERPSGDPRVVGKVLEVRYRVRAGLWQEVEFEEAPADFGYPVLPSPKYAEWPQWLERVEGDSVNLKIPDGHYIHVVDAIEMDYTPTTNDWVVVERRRDQGAIRERTVKQIEVIPGIPGPKVLLWPRSNNPMWRDAVDLGAGARAGEEEIEARIVGLVIGAYDPHF